VVNPNVIAVVGSTGAQGGGLCRAILHDPSGGFSCRALTRDPSKDKARALASEGAQVVHADLDDPESVKRAFAGAYGAFCVTNVWEHGSPEREKAQAKNMADAAKSTGLQHVVWSTLEDTRRFMSGDDTRMPMLHTKYRVPHFDAKGEADAYFDGLPTTYLIASYYWDNLFRVGAGPQKGNDGQYTWTLPMGSARMAGVAAEDIGKIAYGIFKAGQAYVGKRVGAAGEHLTIDEMGRKISKALGIGPIHYNAVEPAVYRTFGFPGADELGNMFQVYRDFAGPMLAARDVSAARSLNPSLHSFDDWLQRNKDRIPV
jgi:uncharacterized protein YbjT (DUF2867 family)